MTKTPVINNYEEYVKYMKEVSGWEIPHKDFKPTEYPMVVCHYKNCFDMIEEAWVTLKDFHNGDVIFLKDSKNKSPLGCTLYA